VYWRIAAGWGEGSRGLFSFILCAVLMLLCLLASKLFFSVAGSAAYMAFVSFLRLRLFFRLTFFSFLYLKWPNYLLANWKKLGRILTEMPRAERGAVL